MEDVKYINGIEQVNIGTVDTPYYIPKPTEKQIIYYTRRFEKEFKKWKI